jgi:hypothetical protein
MTTSNPATAPIPGSKGARTFQGLVLLLLAIILLATVWFGPEEIPFLDFSVAYVVQILTSALLISLFIERTTEVFLNASRGRGKADLKLAHENLKRSLEAKGKDAKAIAVDGEVVAAAAAIDAYRSENQKIALSGGLLLGVIASALGVRLIAPLLEPRVIDELVRDHRRLLVAFDVLITGALLGGGAAGIHSVLDLFLKYVDKQREFWRDAENGRKAVNP